MKKLVEKFKSFFSKQQNEVHSEEDNFHYRLKFGTKVMVDNRVYRYLFSKNDFDIVYNEIDTAIYTVKSNGVVSIDTDLGDENIILSPKEWLSEKIAQAEYQHDFSYVEEDCEQIIKHINEYLEYQKNAKLG